jgi:hypothetical protein
MTAVAEMHGMGKQKVGEVSEVNEVINKAREKSNEAQEKGREALQAKTYV